MAKNGYIGVENTYRMVEYIESSRKQYIDTGFKPKYNTRVVMDAQGLDKSAQWLFGTRDTNSSSSPNQFALYRSDSTSMRSDYFGSNASVDISDITVRTIYDKNGASASFYDKQIQNTVVSSGECSFPLYLFTTNNVGSAHANLATIKLYSCQIYDNGLLVRDYVPCVNGFGEAGLYDRVNGVFYRNAGSGAFAVGAETGEVLTGSVARKISKVYIGVDGVARKVKKAYIGDENGIAREWFSSGLCVGELAVGSSVFMNVGGVRTEFLIVHQGNPSTTYYDNSCSGTWLLMKNIYTKKVSGSKTYTDSTINTYLNGDFLALLDSGVANAIKSVKIPYGVVSDGNLTSKHGSNGALVKVFILSLTEVGFTSDSGVADFNGSALSYFKGIGNGAATKRTAYYNGTADHWFSRTPNKYASGTLYRFVYSTGALGYGGGEYDSYGVRPALVLPSSTGVDEHFNVIA